MPGTVLKAFKASNYKVKLLSFHPTQPWLAFADKGQVIAVMHWRTQQLISEALVGSAEEAQATEAALQRLAERDPSYQGPQTAAAGAAAKPSFPGSIRELAFLDMDTCFWQLAQQRFSQFQYHSDVSSPSIAREMSAQRWLLAACETKILLHSLTNSASIEAPRAIFEAKTPTCLAVLYLNSTKLLSGSGGSMEETLISPVIAAGTSVGTIYLLAVKEKECTLVGKLVGGHKGSVTKLLAIGGKDSSSPEQLVSAGADGTVAVWNPSAAGLSASREATPVAAAKPHDLAVLSMVFAAAASDAPGYAAPRLITSGEDRRVAVLELPALSRQVARWKPLARGNVDGLAYNPWAPQSVQLLAVSGERAAVWSLPSDGRLADANPLIYLDSFLPVGTKKAAKVYAIAVHPLHPGIIAVGANAGVAILSVEGSAVASAAALLPAEASASDLGAVLSGQPFEFLYASEMALWKLSYRAVWTQELLARKLDVRSVAKAHLTKLPARGAPEICLSPSGRHCSLVWPDTCQFAVFSITGPDNWQEVQSGSGTAVAWASSGSHCAILHLPKVVYPEVRKARTKKARAKEEEAAAHAAVHAASLAAQEGGHVRIYSVSSTGSLLEQTSAPVRLPDKPLALHGGPVLGISTHKSYNKGQSRGNSLQFFEWKSAAPIGHELRAPSWLAWEPQVTAVALGYEEHVAIYRAQPSVYPIATLPLQGATSGVWHHRFLLVATAAEVQGTFISAGPEARTPFLESVRLTSLEGGIASQLAGAGDETAPLQCESVQCPGPCAIGGIRDCVLWLIDARGQPFAKPLTHAGLLARIAAAQGDPKAARAVAESGLPKRYHDEIAHFIAEMDPEKGLEEALALTGISPAVELSLSRRAKRFRRALRCFQALALGATDAAAFREFPNWSQRLSELTPLETAPAPKEPAPLLFQHLIQQARANSLEAIPEEEEKEKPGPIRSVLDFIAADNVDEESSEDEELQEQAEAIMGMAQAPAEAIDWDALLTEPQHHPEPAEAVPQTEGDEPMAANGRAESPGIGPEPAIMSQDKESTVSKEEEKRTAELIDEGLLLVDTALGYGHQDVAVAAIHTLLRGTPSLTPDKLQALLIRCSQCNMQSELRAFASKMIADGTGASPETSTLLAALLDNPMLAHSTLRASGMIPQSAIYSHTWKVGNSLQDINDWGNLLTAAAGNSVQFAVVPPTK